MIKVVEEKNEKKHKKSFLSEEEKLERIRKAALSQGEKVEKQVKVLQPEVTLMLLLGQATATRKVMEEIRDIFKNVTKAPEAKVEAKEEVKQEVTKETQEVTATAGPEPPTPQPTSERVLQIREAFKPLDEFVELDETSSAMFVLVRPKGFLGGDKFAKVGDVSKKLGGEYVSQGKASHFRIPKQVKPPAEAPKVASKLEDIKTMFPEDLEQMLNFTDMGDHIKIKPRQFLGSDNFAKIASVVRGIGGDYVSAGKESHFRVQK